MDMKLQNKFPNEFLMLVDINVPRCLQFYIGQFMFLYWRGNYQKNQFSHPTKSKIEIRYSRMRTTLSPKQKK